MKIKTMLMLAAMCFAIVPMAIYTVFAGVMVSDNGDNEFERQMTDLLKNQSSTLEVYLDTVHTQLDMLAGIDVIKDTKDIYSVNTADNILLTFASENAIIDSALLIGPDGVIIAGKNKGTAINDYEKMSEYKDEVLYVNDMSIAAATSSANATMFIKKKVGGNTLALFYKISSDSSDKFIAAITNNSAFYNQGSLIIIDPRGNWTSGKAYGNDLKSKSHESVIGMIPALQDGVMSPIITYSSETGGFMHMKIAAGMIRVGGEDGLIAFASCPVANSGIFSSGAITTIVTTTVLLSILCIVGAIVMSVILTNPLKTIEETLIKIRRGDHEARISTVSNNEYGQISRAFNNLVDEIVVSEDRYRIITEMSDNIIFEWNFKTNEVFFSNNFNKKFSYRPPSDHFGDSFLLKAKIHPDDLERYRQDLEILGRGEEFKHNEYRMKNIYGDFIWVLMRTATLKDAEGNPLKIVGVMLDIDRAKKSEQLLTTRASYDALTELYNRETIESQIDNEINLSEARKSELAVLFIDVDDFKHFNDQYSHATGDRVLKFVAKTIRSVVSEYGFAGRYGGDEFIVCIRNAEINSPEKAAQEIIERLEQGFVSDSGERLTVSVSIGISVIKEDYNTRVEFIIGRADDAMYSVKKNGKSNYAFI